MTMPTAICMSCGVLYLEWAPKYKPDQHCSRCGAPLKILPNTNRGGVAEVDRANKTTRTELRQHFCWYMRPPIGCLVHARTA